MIRYERMNKSHIGGMVKVEEECFGSGFAEKTFLRECDNKIARYVVALKDDTVVGYGGIWNICGEADIIDIGVLSDCRNKGIGGGILSRLIEICKNEECKKITLEVRKTNAAAQRLYQKYGFLFAGERKNYYGNQEDAYLMCLDLN